MKQRKWISVFLTVCLTVTLCALPISAEVEGESASFLGIGRVEAPADSATLRFELLSWSRDLEKAQQEQSRKLQALSERCSALGTLTQDGYYSYEGLSGTRFFVSSSLSLHTTELDRIEEIRAMLKECGASAVFEVCYHCSDLTPFEEEALRLAVQDADRKAAALGLSFPRAQIFDMGSYICCADCHTPLPVVTVECSVRVTYQ